MFVVYFLLLLVISTIVFWPFIVLFHEFGHALSAILLTKNEVTVYINSYGNQENNFSFTIGRLNIFIHRNLFSWKTGLCQFDDQSVSLNRRIIIILFGPLFSLLITLLIGYFAFALDVHGAIKLLLVLFFSVSAWDLIRNLVPNEVPIQLYDDGVTYNDGFQIKRLLYRKIFLKDIETGIKYFESKRYLEATSLFFDVLQKGKRNKDTYGIAMASCLLSGNILEAKRIVDDFVDFGGMTPEDNSNAGLIYSQLGLHKKSLAFYDKALQENPRHKYALMNKGYSLKLLSRHDQAILIFNKVLELYPSLAYAYSNMGLSKIKLGQYEEGLANIRYAIELDTNCPFGYLNLGIYHFDKEEYAEALQLFTKAKEIDYKIYLIDDFIKNTEKNLSNENFK